MGVVNLQWYKDRGLTKRVTKTLTEDSKLTGRKAGESFEYDEVTQGYSCGRIDLDLLKALLNNNRLKFKL